MEIEQTPIEGLLIIKPKVFYDDRGFFLESFNKERYEKAGISDHFIQDNLSESSKGVLRGLHFQAPPHAQGKLVQVLRGAVLDVAVDIREGSPTYGESFTIELNEKNKYQFYIPTGFAHGFLTLEDHTIFSYKCTKLYHKASEGSIIWNDNELNINWNIEQPIVSEKDQEALLFESFKSPFKW